jgi:uncharacterized protein involved in exopolysaccharide biosynthesis
MRIGLNDTDVEIATLSTRLQTQQGEVERLKALVDRIPEIERQLNALNRDYDVTRQQYETLLQRRESLRMTGRVEESGDQLQFRVIDPPRAALAPVGPDRPLLLAGTTVASLGAALVLAFLLHQLNPVFSSRNELRALIGLPVLGSVSLARTPQERQLARRRWLAFAAAATALPVALGVLLLLQEPAHAAFAKFLAVMS